MIVGTMCLMNFSDIKSIKNFCTEFSYFLHKIQYSNSNYSNLTRNSTANFTNFLLILMIETEVLKKIILKIFENIKLKKKYIYFFNKQILPICIYKL